MSNFLAIDAGGTSTRAVLVDTSGHCFGYGTAGGGNPVSRGIGPALEALVAASERALSGTGTFPSQVLIAMAGASLELPLNSYYDSFSALGLTGNVVIESDLLAAFYSGTFHNDGIALIAGTGAVGARITESYLAEVADGTGWLLGDMGSGFWLGQEVARAVAAALDGRGSATALTPLVMEELDIAFDLQDQDLGQIASPTAAHQQGL
ncbi:N-acetylglucosamine kinase [Arthrobacter psychrolactophilus]